MPCREELQLGFSDVHFYSTGFGDDTLQKTSCESTAGFGEACPEIVVVHIVQQEHIYTQRIFPLNRPDCESDVVRGVSSSLSLRIRAPRGKGLFLYSMRRTCSKRHQSVLWYSAASGRCTTNFEEIVLSFLFWQACLSRYGKVLLRTVFPTSGFKLRVHRFCAISKGERRIPNKNL